MSNQPVQLIALRCVKCNTPIPAQPDEIAWDCENCHTGQRLDENTGLVETKLHYHSALQPAQPARPFWVFSGAVTLDRKTYDAWDKGGQAKKFWEVPRQFFIPAYTCDLDHLVDTSIQLLERPIELTEGQPGHFQPITMQQADIQAVAEYVIMAIEAHRKDDIKEIKFTLKITDPQLWLLP